MDGDMKTLEWNDDNKLDDEAVETALAHVRKAGDKQKKAASGGFERGNYSGARVAVAQSQLRSIAGTTTDQTFAVAGTQASTTVTDFRQNNKGDTWSRVVSGPEGTSERSFIASTGVETTCCSSTEPATKYTDVADNDPVAVSPFGTPLGILRRLSFSQNVKAAETVFDKQPAWTLSVANVEDGGNYDAYDITVLQDTSFPVEVKAYVKGALGQSVTVSKLVLNADLTDRDFSVSKPPSVTQSTTAGYIRTPLSGVEHNVGYKAFVPKTVPNGFALTSTSTFKGNGSESVLGKDSTIPIQNRVVLVYRRGLQALTISTQSVAGVSADKWDDPLTAADGGIVVADKPFPIMGGAFNGVIAHKGGGVAGPDVWAVGANYVLSISGDVSFEEMAQVAGSLNQQ